ncbi:TonB-dependent receptor, partial [Pseudomonadales bacterium]|nr:TonB-dependent receptor [Pseudomonadales bacterium]
ASLLHRNVDSNTTPLHVVDEDALAKMPVLSLGESLDSLVGVTTADYGSGVGQPVIRGLSGSRVRVMQNGLIARDVSILGGDHINEVDLSDAQQIEVIRGPASLLFANGTIGGIVNIVDQSIARKDIEARRLRISGQGQSVNDGEAASLSFGDNLGGLNLSYAGSYSNLNDYKVPKGALTHDEDHDEDHDGEHDEDEADHDEEAIKRLLNSDTQRETHKFGISKVGQWGYVGASFARQRTVYGIPVHADEHEEEMGGHDDHDDDHDDEHGDEHGEEERIFSATDSKVWTLEGRADLDGSLLRSVSYHLRDSDYSLIEQHSEAGHEEEEAEEDHDEHGHEEGPTQFTNQSQEFGLNLNFDRESASHRVVLNFASEEIAIVGEESFLNPNKSDEMTAGYYFSRDFASGLHVDFGARFDQVKRRGSLTEHDDHDEDHDEDHEDEAGHENEDEHDEAAETQQYKLDFSTASFAATLSKPLSENLELSLGLAQVERTPSAVELFINGPHLAAQRFEVGDVSLRSEQARNVELSVAYERGSVFSKLSLFNNQIDDYIYLLDESEAEHDAEHDDDHGGLILGNYVQADARFRGYEVEVGFAVALESGTIRVKLARDQTIANFDDGGSVPRIMPSRNLLEINGDFAKFDATLSYQNVSDQQRIAQNELPTDGYNALKFSLRTSFDLGPTTLEATLFARNILDDISRRHTSFVKEQAPLPGRNVGLKVVLAL